MSELISPDAVHFPTDPGYDPAHSGFGPVAAEALRSAAQSEHCTVGIPDTEVGVSVVAAELTAPATQSLIGALRNSDFVEVAAGDGLITFTRFDIGGIHDVATAYVFDQNIWVSSLGGGTEEYAIRLAHVALENIRAAN